MKKSELKQLIKEELLKEISESNISEIHDELMDQISYELQQLNGRKQSLSDTVINIRKITEISLVDMMDKGVELGVEEYKFYQSFAKASE